jgi:hypothetical protein
MPKQEWRMKKMVHLMPALLIGAVILLPSSMLAQTDIEPSGAGVSATPSDDAVDVTAPDDSGASFSIQYGGSAADDRPVPLAARGDNAANSAASDSPENE